MKIIICEINLDLDSDSDGLTDTNESGLTLSGNVGDNGLDSSVDNGDDYSDTNGKIDNPSQDLINATGDNSEVAYREVELIVNNETGDTINGSVGGIALDNITKNDTLHGKVCVLGKEANITKIDRAYTIRYSISQQEKWL